MIKTLKKRKEIWILLLFTLPFIYLALQYFFSANLKIYDASSHVTAVWYLKEYLWPNYSGWNYLNLLGYDQGLLYPTLFHYVSATLAFIFGVNLSVKLVLSLGILSVPVSTYFFSTIFFQKLKARVFLVGFILVAWVIFPAYWGGGLKSLTELGLLPSFTSLPVLFFYFSSLSRLDNKKFLLPTLLLSVLLLTHIVAGLVATLYLLVLILVKFKFKELNKYYFSHLLLSILLTSFFTFPFLLSSNFLSTSAHVSSLGLINFASVLVAGIFIFIFYKSRKVLLLTVSILVFLLAVACSGDYFVEKFINSGQIYEKIYNLHLYRFQIYQYLLLIPLLFYWPLEFLFNLKNPKIKPVLVVSMPVIILLFLTFFRTGSYFYKGGVEVHKVKNSQGRFLEAFSREQSYPFIYTSQNQLVEEKQPWSYGLFTDANPNGPYLGSLIKSLSSNQAENKSGYFTETKLVDWERIPDYLNLFAVENLEYIDYSKPISSSTISFFTLKVKNQNLVESPNLKVETISKNWESAVAAWWEEKGKLTKLLAYDQSGSLKVTNNRATSVKIVSNNKNFSNFEISIANAKAKVPVLVKFSYFPGWKAYENGQEIPIYRTSPNLMLVFARENVRFVYDRTWYQNLAFWISFATLLGLGIYEIRKYTKSKKQ